MPTPVPSPGSNARYYFGVYAAGKQNPGDLQRVISMMTFSVNRMERLARPSFLLILFPLLVLACDSDPQQDGSRPDGSTDGVGDTIATGSVDQGVEKMIETGERYASILQELYTADDVEEHRQELVRVFATMKELETAYGDHQRQITAQLDTSVRSVALNERLRNELMRIAGDSALATRLAELRASVTGVPLE